MSFNVNGANFDPTQYYRDDEQARSILWTCRENPVLLTGLRRIGKSWFLRRFEQIFRAGATRHFTDEGVPSERALESGLPRAAVVLDGKSETFEGELQAVIARADRDLVLAVDELEKLVADSARQHLVAAILAYRPLVLAASPIIFELARTHSPALAQFFEEGCVTAVLRPLSRGERRALALQVCDPGEGVLESSVAMALWWDWGGHPLVLQQIGALIRERAGSDAQGLTSTAHARLNLGAPAYGTSLAGETGLTRAQREVLAQVAAGSEPGDEHVAAVLADHGAIVRRKSGWAIENCVLRRHLQGSSFTADETSGSTTPTAATTRRTRTAPVRVFSWIHLSDLHFGAGSQRHRFDQKKVMKAIVRDVQEKAPRDVNRILVTGDIAFSAQPAEYVEAQAWMNKIVDGAGVGRDRLRFVPGNHDIDRKVAKKPLVRSAHEAVRAGLVELDDLLADPDGLPVLSAKLGAYQGFVAGFGDHPPALDKAVDWFELIDVPGGHGKLRIVGLSSVWVSDEKDEKPNLALALGPIQRMCEDAARAEVMFVLTHHPQEWMHEKSARHLDGEIAQLPHIHFCGHVHDARAGITKRFGSTGKGIRYVAGAAHGDPNEEPKHGIAWGALRYDPAAKSWQAGWAPRIFVDDGGGMRADRTRYTNLDAEGFAWEDLDCSWLAP